MADTIYFRQNFEKSSKGNYDHGEFLIDWKSPSYLISAVTDGKFENIEIIDCNDFEKPLRVSRWILPIGCFNPDSGGGKWDTALTENSYITKIDEVYLTFKIKFCNNFIRDNLVWLPGLTGPNWEASPGDDPGFNVILTYRNNKLAFRITDQIHHEPPLYVDWDFNFEIGTWYTITLRMVLNTDSESNGIIEGFINGKLKCQVNNLTFRLNNTIRIHAIRMQIFINYHEPINPINTWIEIDDVVAYNYDPEFKKEHNIAVGNNCTNTSQDFTLPPPRLNEQIDPDLRPPIVSKL